jgi:hypothetical protein
MTNREFRNREQYSDGKYRVLNITDGERDLRRITCDIEGICLIPFDTSDGKIKNVYLAKYMDYLSNEHGHTCINLDSKGEYSSDFEEVKSACKNELNIECEVNDVYYIGKVKHQMPFSKTYKCYAINLDRHSNDLSGFTLSLPKSEEDKRLYSLDRIRFTRVLNGEIEDSMCLAASMLLISYLN